MKFLPFTAATLPLQITTFFTFEIRLPGQFRWAPKSFANPLSQRVSWASRCQGSPSSVRAAAGAWSSRQDIRDQGLIREPCSWSRTTRWANQLTQAWASALGCWGRSLPGGRGGNGKEKKHSEMG